MDKKNLNNKLVESDKAQKVDSEKRDFLFMTTTGLALAGGAIAAWTLIDTQ